MAGPFKCGFCEKSYTNDHSRKRHERSIHHGQGTECINCGRQFRANFELQRHLNSARGCVRRPYLVVREHSEAAAGPSTAPPPPPPPQHPPTSELPDLGDIQLPPRPDLPQFAQPTEEVDWDEAEILEGILHDLDPEGAIPPVPSPLPEADTPYRCHSCPERPIIGDMQDFADHMLNVHKVMGRPRK